MIMLKRIYETAEQEDGFRILVDRVWPRGLSKAKAQVDLWLKDIAPSTELRQWFGHDPERWPEFQKRYQQELQEKPSLVEELKQYEEAKGTVTLLFSAKDMVHNNAVVLKDYLSS